MTKPRVGFIGLGIMGLPMAGHILEAGYPLSVFNRTASKSAALAKRGAVTAGSPAEVAGRSDVVLICVPDSPDVEQVVCGADGVLGAIRSGSVVVDMSTVSPDVERRLDAKLREVGCTLIDAPVSGGDTGARSATLAIMAGGAPTSRPYLCGGPPPAGSGGRFSPPAATVSTPGR